jgi:hypothetical protein
MKVNNIGSQFADKMQQSVEGSSVDTVHVDKYLKVADKSEMRATSKATNALEAVKVSESEKGKTSNTASAVLVGKNRVTKTMPSTSKGKHVTTANSKSS